MRCPVCNEKCKILFDYECGECGNKDRLSGGASETMLISGDELKDKKSRINFKNIWSEVSDNIVIIEEE